MEKYQPQLPSLPNSTSGLSRNNETAISISVRETLGIDAKFELEGQKLNHQYGWMGAGTTFNEISRR